jgi:hypothetical protein
MIHDWSLGATAKFTSAEENDFKTGEKLIFALLVLLYSHSRAASALNHARL